MKSRYLIRFDDICPTMNWSVWESVESILLKYHIKPILAVVPDNQDPQLVVDAPRPDFWEKVRQWQSYGWTIALHGYQHLYCASASGLIGLNDRSEFAGLSYGEQRTKLEAAINILRRERLQADAWIAPMHAFDANTVKALCDLGIDVISDGFFTRPLRWQGARWVPQQLWRFRQMPAGLWTVCYHHNTWSEMEIQRLESDIKKYQSQIRSLAETLNEHDFSAHCCLDRLFASLWLFALKATRRSA